jgi:hypothetical protein
MLSERKYPMNPPVPAPSPVIELPSQADIQDDLDRLDVDQTEFLKCFRYVAMRETSFAMTHIATAKELGISPQGLYGAIKRWENNGLLPWIRERWYVPMYAEAIKVMNRRVMADWDKVLEKQLRTAKSGTSEQFSLQAAQWLHTTIIEPEQQRLQDGGKSSQAKFLEKWRELKANDSDNPMSPGRRPSLPAEITVEKAE